MHYGIQVQHQLNVVQADMADVFVIDGSEGILLEVTPDPSAWPRIHEAWEILIPEQAGVDVEKLRGAARGEARITVLK